MTAEFATVLPAVVLVLGCCLGAVAVVGQQVRLADSAADAARSLARGDDPGHAVALAARAGSEVALISERRGEFTCAILRAPSTVGPFAALGLIVEASSCALAGGL
ncbi:TadE family type IV pilus minor pilin [Leifsonia sp. A12D58]|uniref:TadE family type IV pilus minor pilin n=1 Tax=Leifsonia sp. A12D58 TaxID=3397674 RepID=UPI0039E1C665